MNRSKLLRLTIQATTNTCVLSTLCLLLTTSPVSLAQDNSSQIIDAESLVKDSVPAEAEAKPEEAPPPEAPYPNAKAEESVESPKAPPAPSKIAPENRGNKLAQPRRSSPERLSRRRPQAPLKVDAPKAVDEDGTYLYGRSNETDERDVNQLQLPEVQSRQRQRPLKLTQPLEIKSNGEYFYGYEKVPHDRAASLKFGYFEPPKLTNPQSNFSFSQLYTGNPIPTFFFDYEYQLNGRFGGLGIRLGTGLFFANGTGRFVNADKERDPNTIPGETFTFIMLPNTLTGLYHFQYWEKQLFTPYVGGGVGYFVFSELRDDGQAPKFGGAGVSVVNAGINILIDGVDPFASRELEANYGISHVSLNFEFSEIVGLNPNFDFSSSVINAGVAMEF